MTLEEVKQSIISSVSSTCMAPPGMSDDEVRIAIAEAIANHADWNVSFQQIQHLDLSHIMMLPMDNPTSFANTVKSL